MKIPYSPNAVRVWFVPSRSHGYDLLESVSVMADELQVTELCFVFERLSLRAIR